MGTDLDYDELPLNCFIGREPRWITKFGITIISLFFLLVICFSLLIRYPDTISSSIVLTTLTPPAKISATTSGLVKEVYVKDNQLVTEGQALLLIESNITSDTLEKLLMLLDEYSDLNKLINPTYDSIIGFKLGGLGELQSNFSKLTSLMIEHIELTSKLSNEADTSTLLATIEKYSQMKKETKLNIGQLSRKVEIKQALFNKTLKLYKQKIIESNQKANAEIDFIDASFKLKELRMKIAEYDFKIKEASNSLIKIKEGLSNKIEFSRSSILNTYYEFTSEFEKWQKKHLIKSPVSGRVSFTNLWAKNQKVNNGKDILSVYEESDLKIGVMNIGAFGAGKVNEKQEVHIELDKFPAAEFGYIYGDVKSLSILPFEGDYLVHVKLPVFLESNTGKAIPFTPEMTGKAKIITYQKNLFERILGTLVYMFK